MAEVVVMPQLGNTVESCLVTAWRVRVGDQVSPGTVVADIETDKSAMEVPAGVAGTILALLVGDGAEVPVKAPFFIVGEPGESIEGLVPAPTASPVEPAAAADEVVPTHAVQPDDVAETVTGAAAASAAASPRARRAAAEAGVDVSQIAGSGPHGRVLASDVASAAQSAAAAPVAEPATEPSVEPGRYTRGALAEPASDMTAGTGIGGRVTRHDIEEAAVAVPAVVPPTAQPGEFPGAYTDTPLKGIRKLVAERMLASMAAHAQLTFDSSAPAAALLALRARLKAADPALGLNQITIGDLVAYAAVRTALTFPSVNATVENQVLRSFADVHLGLAVDTPRGLLVPTIRFASRMGLPEFSANTKVLADQARSGSINPDLMTGATFTVTNLGAYGIESFTPILNSPQTAILGVDAIRPRPAVGPGGELSVEQRIGFSLTVDHAVVDGADAARFLQALVKFVTDIDLVLLIGGGLHG